MEIKKDNKMKTSKIFVGLLMVFNLVNRIVLISNGSPAYGNWFFIPFEIIVLIYLLASE